MILNSVASALFLTIGFTTFSNQMTLAQSVDIHFRGVVEPHASFESISSGKIESNLSGKAGKSTNGFTDSTPAKINVQTSNPTTIIVSNSTDILNKSHAAILQVGSNRAKGNSITLSPGKNTVEVDLLLKQNQILAPGTYNYDITLTMVSP
ncbi:MAG: hypothetical protein KI793_31100 [Rivularia sp. (in: Bacteria)]|nr:hypothetical protein [Rivularia sp. MS3]